MLYYHIGPVFVSINGSWFIITKTVDCQYDLYGRDYCRTHALDVLIASAIYNFGAFATIFAYLLSLIFPKRVSFYTNYGVELRQI